MNPPEHFYALLPCAGSGQRAGTAQPKQYQLLGGVPLVVHTLRALGAVTDITRGLLVIAPDDTTMAGVLARYPQTQYQVAAVGGLTRAASVLAGLNALMQSGAREQD